MPTIGNLYRSKSTLSSPKEILRSKSNKEASLNADGLALLYVGEEEYGKDGQSVDYLFFYDDQIWVSPCFIKNNEGYFLRYFEEVKEV